MRKISNRPALTKHIIHNYDLLLSGSDEIKPDLVVLIKVQYDWKEESAEEERNLLFQSNSEVRSHSCHSCWQRYVVRGFICEDTYQVWQNINLSLEVDDMHLSLEVEDVSLSLQEVGVCQLVTGGCWGRWSPSSLTNCNTGSWCDHSGTEIENM